jgi:hypothetical protein
MVPAPWHEQLPALVAYDAVSGSDIDVQRPASLALQ